MLRRIDDGPRGGKYVTLFLEESEVADMRIRDSKGHPKFITLIPPQLVPLDALFITILTSKERKTANKIEDILKEEGARVDKRKNLSPCCGVKMIHDDDDEENISTCSSCLKKYKNESGVWIRDTGRNAENENIHGAEEDEGKENGGQPDKGSN